MRHIIQPLLLRGLQAAGLNSVIALALSLAGSQSLATNLVYSQCIGLSIWLLIDGGRMALIRDWSRQRHWLLVIVPVSVGLGYSFGLWLGGMLLGEPSVVMTLANPGKALGLLTMSLAAGVALTSYFLSREQLQEARSRAEALQRQAAEAQLKLLQTQLEPHMLFNTLANLRALITTHPARATDMLDRLVAYLRATLQASRATTHPLQAEFDRLRDYLELMAVRMGPRLAFTLDLPPNLASHHVPTLLLQPLVENSLQHALEPHIQGGRIAVSARQHGAQLVLQVHDTGTAFDTESLIPGAATGFGLAQVRERLATRYGSAAQLHFTTQAEGGLLASMMLPMESTQPPP